MAKLMRTSKQRPCAVQRLDDNRVGDPDSRRSERTNAAGAVCKGTHTHCALCNSMITRASGRGLNFRRQGRSRRMKMPGRASSWSDVVLSSSTTRNARHE